MFIDIEAEEAVNLRTTQADPAPQPTPLAGNLDEAEKARIRRQMYERIARGQAIAQVEENAARTWKHH